jgi:folylpolyglutamate synthase/dihydropteroate synthase
LNGGRLDATNITLVSVITNIGSHTVSRNTIEAIAGEKGYYKTNTSVVIGEYTPKTKAVFFWLSSENQFSTHLLPELICSVPSF